ncbi:MAG: glycogen debranching enzyme family protein [Bacteroidaceae bacterium]|nr:glycogen debranching enzyme family protein [Bacteroidaceae bacterium]
MSYLKFDKRLMINLEQSLRKELLRTNRSGAYHCTTIVDCNTRKQHGLLVMPIPEFDNENFVLLSTLDETVIQHGAPFNLGLHKYQGDCFSPNGHKYIREFDCDDTIRKTYRVGGVILTKEKIFEEHQNRILIKYTLVEAHSPTTLQFRPFLAFRPANELCMENEVIDKSYEEVPNGISCCLYKGYPRLYMQCSKKPQFVYEPHWYKGIEYIKDQQRGLPYTEDLFVPGYFELSIKKGESIIFAAGVQEAKPRSLARIYQEEYENRTPRNSFFNCLKNAAQQFYLKQGRDLYLLAGYPWFGVRARDQFISLPGCTLAIGDVKAFDDIMKTAEHALRNFMKDGSHDPMIKEIEIPDVPLWAIWTIQQYARELGNKACYEKYGKLVADILSYIIKGEHPNLQVHDNALLYANGRDRIISWMNSTLNGAPINPRSGYLVEINALWYNALKFAANLFTENEINTPRIEQWKALSDTIATSFGTVFLNDYGYLYDYVDGTMTDWSVRPNMLIAISLEYSPLDRRQRKAILDIVTKELLTPKGIRSLSPKSWGYRPWYTGSPEERALAQHQGPARPWLMGAYADAYLRIFGIGGVAFIERMLIGYEDDLSDKCIGSISEMFDGNPPYTARGAISYAKNVGEVLRVLHSLKKYNL